MLFTIYYLKIILVIKLVLPCDCSLNVNFFYFYVLIYFLLPSCQLANKLDTTYKKMKIFFIKNCVCIVILKNQA